MIKMVGLQKMNFINIMGHYLLLSKMIQSGKVSLRRLTIFQIMIIQYQMHISKLNKINILKLNRILTQMMKINSTLKLKNLKSVELPTALKLIIKKKLIKIRN